MGGKKENYNAFSVEMDCSFRFFVVMVTQDNYLSFYHVKWPAYTLEKGERDYTVQTEMYRESDTS